MRKSAANFPTNIPILVGMLTFIACWFMFVSLQAQSVAQGPRIQFDYLIQDNGRLPEGADCEYTFPFTNVGDAPLKLLDVKGTTGAVAVDWPKEAIAPGDKGTISAQFLTAGKIGQQCKTITVHSNDSLQPRIVLTYKVDVFWSDGRIHYTVPSGADAIEGSEYNRPVIACQSTGYKVLQLNNLDGNLLKVDVTAYNSRSNGNGAVLLTRFPSEVAKAQAREQVAESLCTQVAKLGAGETIYLILRFDTRSNLRMFKGNGSTFSLPIGVERILQ